MPRYDYSCQCGEVIRDHEKMMNDPNPPCPKCGKELNRLYDQQVVYFKGITSPGGNGTPNFKNLPSEIRGWAENKYEQDRHFESEVKKPMEWPDGTVQEGIP